MALSFALSFSLLLSLISFNFPLRVREKERNGLFAVAILPWQLAPLNIALKEHVRKYAKYAQNIFAGLSCTRAILSLSLSF